MSEDSPPRRIVSLVPSLTETLVTWGCLEQLVGRTRFCIEPAGVVETVETVGGTKDPDVARIIALQPDLVILNKEENRREDGEALVAAGLRVVVTHPRSVGEAADMLEDLGRWVGSDERAKCLADACRGALAQTHAMARTRAPVSVFCPIWRNPWMTFRASTYIGDVLASVGLQNIFGDAGATTDFFTVELENALARDPEMILLPNEPYAFSPRHAEDLRRRGAKSLIVHVDGKDLSWYGPRVPRALERLWTIRREISRI